jgi:TldD protein
MPLGGGGFETFLLERQENVRHTIRAMHDIAETAVQAALDAGATYADARVMETRAEAMAARNGVVETLDREERAGVGVRALIGSSWGFFAVPDVSPAAARRAGERSAEVARASAMVAGRPLDLAEQPPAQGSWASDCLEDPWDVTPAEKGDLLEGVTRAMLDDGADLAEVGDGDRRGRDPAPVVSGDPWPVWDPGLGARP